MATIYVAGPVLRVPDIADAEALDRIYSMIGETAQSSRLEPRFPEPEYSLDRAAPKEFYGEISSRIEEADAVITVLSPFDLSAASESTIAAIQGKQQLLVLNGLDHAPRILEGMPSMTVVSAENDKELSRALRKFMEAQAPPPSVVSSA